MKFTRNVNLILWILLSSNVFVESNMIRDAHFPMENVVLNNVTRFTRIVGGSNATVNQFPHATALFLFLTTGESFCGGSIIHVNFILTAAHCLDNIMRIEVQAGSLTIFQGMAPYTTTVLPRDTRQHPQYNAETLLNDIGLIYVMQPFRFSNNLIQPIALPSRIIASNLAGQVLIAIGWGRFADSRQTLSDTLQFVRLPVIQEQQCTSVYNTFHPFFNSQSNICVSGSNGRSTCNGDSGGSMSLMLHGRQTLMGIVSYGSATCEGGMPVAATRVSAYLDWIASNTGMRC